MTEIGNLGFVHKTIPLEKATESNVFKLTQSDSRICNRKVRGYQIKQI